MKALNTKTIYTLCVLLLLVVLMAACSAVPSDDEITSLIRTRENLTPTDILSIDEVEKTKDAFDITATIQRNYETYESIETKMYTAAYEDKELTITRVVVQEHPAYYPLIGSDITTDEVESFLRYSLEYEVQGSEDTISISDITYTEIERTTSIDNPPYTETIVYNVEKDTNSFIGNSSVKVNLSFSETTYRWRIDHFEQLEPMVFEWKDGKSFSFNDADLTDYLGSMFGTLSFTSDDVLDTVSISDEDTVTATVVQQPVPVSYDACEAIVDMDATNGVYNIKAQIACQYKSNGGNKWRINDARILSLDCFEKPELMGTWEGFSYFADVLFNPSVKHNTRIVLDEYIESNGQYSGTVYIFADESFNDEKLLVSYKVRAIYSDVYNCLQFDAGEILTGKRNHVFDFDYTFPDSNTLSGETGFSAYSGNIHESVLTRVL